MSEPFLKSLLTTEYNTKNQFFGSVLPNWIKFSWSFVVIKFMDKCKIHYVNILSSHYTVELVWVGLHEVGYFRRLTTLKMPSGFKCDLHKFYHLQLSRDPTYASLPLKELSKYASKLPFPRFNSENLFVRSTNFEKNSDEDPIFPSRTSVTARLSQCDASQLTCFTNELSLSPLIVAWKPLAW